MPRCGIEWLDEAKADVRRLDRPTAMRIFDSILHYASTGGGDVTPLHDDMAGSFRLRLGDLARPVRASGQRYAHLRRPPSLRGLALNRPDGRKSGLFQVFSHKPVAGGENGSWRPVRVFGFDHAVRAEHGGDND